MQYTSADAARKRKSPRRSLRFRKPAKLCNRGPVNAIGARQLLDLLACPKCGGELERAGESFLCTNSACAARFGLAGGHIFHGEMLPGQLLDGRYASERFEGIDGLYLAGSGAHPGGAVTGAPGYLAARAVLDG